MRDFFSTFTSYELWELVVELGLIWLFVFLVFRFLRGTRGAGVVKGFAVLLALLLLLALIGLNTESFGRLQFIVNYVIGLVYILLIVIFQPELRQAAIRIGQARFLRPGREPRQAFVESISEAVDFLSRNQFGALIAIERSVRLGGLVEGGQMLDARISARLLQSIFWPNSPLHDLGVVVREDRILAAGVQFPLAEEGTLPVRYGSRHRAAVGLATESDCVVVIVSEETGIISLAVNGRLESPIPRERFAAVLGQTLEMQVDDSGTASRADEAPSTEANPAAES
ncbi:MAG: diadenylate cyclase CdaA [Phycisphaerales bacterium]|nr:diadenylate cyclase CdaA [Phycisphaerales bacterium]